MPLPPAPALSQPARSGSPGSQRCLGFLCAETEGGTRDWGEGARPLAATPPQGPNQAVAGAAGAGREMSRGLGMKHRVQLCLRFLFSRKPCPASPLCPASWDQEEPGFLFCQKLQERSCLSANLSLGGGGEEA